MVLVVIVLNVISFVIGWKWGEIITPVIWKYTKIVAAKIAELIKKLWDKIFKK